MENAKSATSETFTFYVGPEKREFQVEIDPVAQISKPLSALMKGCMREGMEKRAELPEVEVKVFEDFLQFVKTGRCPSAIIEKIHKCHFYNKFFDNVSEAQNEQDRHIVMLKLLRLGKETFYCYTCGTKTSLWNTACGRYACVGDLYGMISDATNRCHTRPFCAACGCYRWWYNKSYYCEDCRNPNPPQVPVATQLDCAQCLDIMVTASSSHKWHLWQKLEGKDANTSVELLLNEVYQHCKMYVFADTYCIGSLRQTIICLIWSQLFLVEYEMGTNREKDFSLMVHILEYVITNTRSSVGSSPYSAKTDKLCMVMTDFAVHQKLQLAKIEGYTELIEHNAEVTKELFLAGLRMSLDRPEVLEWEI